MNSFTLLPDKGLSEAFEGRYAYMYAMYPNLNFWKDFNSSSSYEQALANLPSYMPDEPTQLYLHFPFCQKICHFCSCFKVKSNAYDGKPTATFDSIQRELIKLKDFQSSYGDFNIKNVHFGGGSPTFLSDEDLGHFVHLVSELTLKTSLDELAIEVDPRNVDVARLSRIADMGFTRVSFGIQDFSHEVQEAVNRIQPKSLLDDLLKSKVRSRFHSVSFDILTGLPRQTLENFDRTIDAVLEFMPDRVVLLTYNHSPDLYRVQRKIDSNDLPSKVEKDEFWAMGASRLLEAGYKRMGLEHFVKETDRLYDKWLGDDVNWNMSGYSPGRGNKIIGIGPSAVSKITDDYYFQNYSTVHDYKKAVLEDRQPIRRFAKLSQDDKIRREVVTYLRSRLTVDLNELTRIYQIDYSVYFKDELRLLQKYIEMGVVTFRDGRIDATEVGKPFIAFVCMLFDRYSGECI